MPDWRVRNADLLVLLLLMYHATIFAKCNAGRCQLSNNHTVVLTVGIGREAIGMVVSLPMAIDNIAEFVASARGEIKFNTPKAVSGLPHGH